MSKQITVDQSHAVMAILATHIDWSQVDPDLLQESVIRNGKVAGFHATAFLKAGARMSLSGVIDMDAPSKRVPKEWKVKDEDQLPKRVFGQVQWYSAKSSLFLSEKQKSDYDQGHDLRKHLENQEVYSDAVMDFYLDHPEIPTPEEWRGKWIFFWGRIYRDAYDDLIVRCLYCSHGGARDPYCNYLGSNFNSSTPALVAGK